MQFIVPLSLVGIVILALLLGNYVRTSYRMPDTGWKVSLIMIVLGVATVILLTSWPPKQGIDLAGGVILIYEVDQELTRQNARQRRGEDSDSGATDQELGRVDMPALIQALSRRINPGGVQEIVVRKYGDSQVEIIIPKVKGPEVERVKKLITTGGFLKFMIVANERDHGYLWNLADDPNQEGQYEVLDNDGNVVGQWVKLQINPQAPEEEQPAYRVDPLTAKSRTVRGHKEVLMVVDPLFDLQGSDLASVRSGFKDVNPCVFFDMTVTGARKMGGLTTNNLPDTTAGHYSLLGIVMDGELVSAPRINETITSNGIIEGQFTKEEVDLLVNVLRAGRLPAVLRADPISQNEISPLLGDDTIAQGKTAIAISLVAVLVFMAIYYLFAGVVACLALVTNLVLILALMIFVGAAFSLPGMAGLVLTVGMSVDANVLIFERIREELRNGAALRMAIRNGFGRATRTIVDANVTTLITAVVLYGIGNEQLRAFAVTLIFGILMCLFTAIFCSRVIFDIAERRRWIKKLRMLHIVTSPNWNLIGKRHIAGFCSVTVIVVGLIAVYFRGPQIFDIDFLGGTSVQLLLKEDNRMPVAEVRQLANKMIDDGIVEEVSVTEVQSEQHGRGRIYRIDTSLPVEDESTDPPEGRSTVSPVTTVQTALINTFKDPAGSSILQTHAMNYLPPIPIDRSQLDPESIEREKEASIDAEVNNDAFDSTSGPDGLVPAANGTDDNSSSSPAGDEGDQSSYDRPGDNLLAMADQILLAQADTDTSSTPEAETETTSDTETSNAETSDAETSNAGTTETVTPTLTTTADASQSNLEFDEEINADTLTALVHETAEGLNLVRPDVVLLNDEWDGQGSQGYPQWTIRLSSNAEQAEQVLAALKGKLDGTPVWLAANQIGSKVAGDKTRMAVAAVIASLLGIIGYIWIRFQRVVYGLAAVVALVHDVLVTLGAIAVSAWLTHALGFLLIDEFKIGLPVVAAFLTIIGYSLNDTIVVFDRIREVKGKSPNLTAEIVNKSINQTLSRTVLTSLTTLIAVIILYVIGGQGIHAFAYALLVGVIVGTYSSIFVASPVLLWMSGSDKPERVREKVAA